MTGNVQRISCQKSYSREYLTEQKKQGQWAACFLCVGVWGVVVFLVWISRNNPRFFQRTLDWIPRNLGKAIRDFTYKELEKWQLSLLRGFVSKEPWGSLAKP
jgi:hypothetical protein